jgi:hypothetical protein
MTATAPSKRAMLLEKTSAAAKPCSRGLYDRRSDVGLVIEPAAWMAGGVVHSGEKADASSGTCPTVLGLVKSMAAIWWEAKKTRHPSRLMGRMAARSPRRLPPD